MAGRAIMWSCHSARLVENVKYFWMRLISGLARLTQKFPILYNFSVHDSKNQQREMCSRGESPHLTGGHQQPGCHAGFKRIHWEPHAGELCFELMRRRTDRPEMSSYSFTGPWRKEWTGSLTGNPCILCRCTGVNRRPRTSAAGDDLRSPPRTSWSNMWTIPMRDSTLWKTTLTE